ncbi:hypothetical protein [Xanthomonas oryzae]|uniref:hypothetical protein n=1 Tax=Xanthomonas oryzae TaxID=347 RepID=UPI0013DDFCDF|nr:hypothetical protein [Xanthomonas oryzae]QIF24115.1 hypothetical protein G6N84_21095 [Xanthomonas oryzae pv. oryzae]
MIISPPFLIARNANEAEDSWLARAMPLADSGTYPVSELLGWHGGIHLRAPSAGTGTEPEVSPHFFLRDQALVASRRGRRCAHGARFKVTKPEKSANHARQRSIAEVPV